jgi:hypothetical protein
MDKWQAREHNTRRARFLCQKHGCSKKQAEEHLDMIVNRAWNPHPSQEFINWWHTHPHYTENKIDAVRARNCKCYVDEYKAAVEVGLAELPVDYPT